MIELKEFISRSDLSRATIFRKISKGEIITTKKGKSTFVITDKEVAFQTALDDRILNWNLRLEKAHNNELLEKTDVKYDKELKKNTIESITKEVSDTVVYMKLIDPNFKINGFDKKSLYRKIATGKVNRSIHSNKGEYKNEIVARMLTDITDIAKDIYIYNADRNINLTVHLTYEAAQLFAKEKNRPELLEILKIPRSTLYKVLTKEADANKWKDAQLLINHANLWEKNLARVTGAFTDDINFMDYIVGDDHKCDVFKVLRFNELRKEFESKTLFTWFWIEVKTQRVLSFVIKTTEINSDDLKKSLLWALQQSGKPNKGVLVDNGIARSAEFQNFCLKLGVDVNYSKPYQPTNKSTCERIFGYIKKEHDVFFNNYTGSNHAIEGKHSGLALTPAAPDYTFEDFRNSLVSYINGFYETRIRTRTINGKKVDVSIADFFDYYWNNEFTPTFIPAQQMRYAYQSEKIATFNNKLKFKGEFYIPSCALSSVFNEKKYKVCYNPNDLTSIDIYALQDILDKSTGEMVYKNGFVATLKCIRQMGPTKRADVMKYNNEVKKNSKEYAKSLVSNVAMKSHELTAKLNSNIANNGKSILKTVEKKVNNILKHAVPEQVITNIINNESGDIEVIIPEELSAHDVRFEKFDTVSEEEMRAELEAAGEQLENISGVDAD